MKGVSKMKAATFVIGIAAGMAMATAGVIAMYPDVSRRMMRDSRRALRCGRRAVGQIGNLFG